MPSSSSSKSSLPPYGPRDGCVRYVPVPARASDLPFRRPTRKPTSRPPTTASITTGTKPRFAFSAVFLGVSASHEASHSGSAKRFLQEEEREAQWSGGGEEGGARYLREESDVLPHGAE